jgi:transcriptional regulator with XRE-family HTH domain
MAGKKLNRNGRPFLAVRFRRMLRTARAAQDLTLEGIADRFPVWAEDIVDSATLSRYENGHFQPHVLVLIAIAEAYGVSESSLIQTLRDDIHEWAQGEAA